MDEAFVVFEITEEGTCRENAMIDEDCDISQNDDNETILFT